MSILELVWRSSQSGGTEMGWTCPEGGAVNVSIEGCLLEEEKLVGCSGIELAYIQSLQFRQNTQLLLLQGASMF